MIIEEVKNFNEFLNLKEDWNRLLRKSSFNTVFSMHEWYKCWWEAYCEKKELYILRCKKGDRLLGIAPLMISRGHYRGLPIKKISFIENDETPHCGLILDHKADPAEAISSICDYLTRTLKKWDILWLRKIPEYDYSLRYLKSYFSRKGYKFITRPSLKSPILEIESGWDTFYSGKNQRFKKKVRNDFNKLKKQGDIQIQRLDTPEQIEPILKEVFHVGSKSWKGKLGKSIGSNSSNRRFFSSLPRCLRDGNRIALWVLRLKGRMIAFEYHVEENNTIYALRGSYDDAYSHLSPGSSLDFEIIRNLFENNYLIYNMGGSPDKYKLRWTKKFKTHYDILIFNRKIYSDILYFLENKIRPIAKRLFE